MMMNAYQPSSWDAQIRTLIVANGFDATDQRVAQAEAFITGPDFHARGDLRAARKILDKHVYREPKASKTSKANDGSDQRRRALDALYARNEATSAEAMTPLTHDQQAAADDKREAIRRRIKDERLATEVEVASRKALAKAAA